MTDRSPSIRVTHEPLLCRRCGSSELITSVEPFGTERIWYTYCPTCNDFRERASIPEWFLRGLPKPPKPRRCH